MSLTCWISRSLKASFNPEYHVEGLSLEKTWCIPSSPKNWSILRFCSTLRPKQKKVFQKFFPNFENTAMLRMDTSFLATHLIRAPIKYMLPLKKGRLLRAKERKQFTYKDHGWWSYVYTYNHCYVKNERLPKKTLNLYTPTLICTHPL